MIRQPLSPLVGDRESGRAAVPAPLFYVVETSGHSFNVPAGETTARIATEVRVAGPNGYSRKVGQFSYAERKTKPEPPAVELLRARARSICAILNAEAEAV